MQDRAMGGWAVAALAFALAAACVSPPDPAESEHRREAAAPRLIAALERGDETLRARAALAMGRIQSATYAEPLARATRDRDPGVRRAAWFALGQLGLLVGSPAPEVAVLASEQALSSTDAETVAGAAEALGKLAPADAAAKLAPLLAHGSVAVRREAAHALFRLRFAPVWRGEATEPPPLPPYAVEALIDALADAEAEVRRAAAHAMSRWGEPEAVIAQSTMGRDPDPWVRLFAVRGIARAGTATDADAILWAVEDADPSVRAEGVLALATLERADLLASSVAEDDSLHVRAAAARALAATGDDASLELLRRLETDSSPRVREAAIGALASRLGADYLNELERHAAERRWSTRVAAVEAAGEIGAPAAGLLYRASGANDPRVRTAALTALGALPDLPRVAELVDTALGSQALGERATAVGLLAASDREDRHARLAEVYERSAGVEWIEVRELVIDAVAEIEDPGDLLRRAALEDPAASVRAKARKVLEDRGESVLRAPSDAPAVPLARRRPFKADPTVVLQTNKGELTIRCFAEDAPVHVSNFVRLVEEGFYDGLVWHRVVTNFVIQGGDPLGSGWGGPGYAIPDEINRRRYVRGTVGMPKAGKDTGGCQIFITHLPTPHLDGNYTVFGQVTSGLDVIDRIEVGDVIERAYLGP